MKKMRRVAALLFFICLPLAASANGKVYPRRAIPVPVNIPDQRALIHWSKGVERLVIETRFTGEGTNFAWVVPLPAKPEIEAATTGLFPTLEYLIAPELVHRVTRWYLGVLGVLGLLYLMGTVKPGKELGPKQWCAWLAVSICTAAGSLPTGVAVGLFLATAMILVRTESGAFISILVLVLLMFLLSGLLLPGLARSQGSMAGASMGARDKVEVLDRKQAGIFDTTILAARDPSALNAWLRENGFAVSTNADTVVAAYVKEGWVFMAAKVHRDQSTAAPTAPHPLSFTFPSTEPVYPMRLTGVDNGPVSVELYVFGPGLASAPGFKTDRCTRPEFPAPPAQWTRFKPKTLQIHSSTLREWVQGASVATRLSARLAPRQMTRDVRLEWLPFEELQSKMYSPAAAGHTAANWGSAILAAGFVFGSLLMPWLRKRASPLPAAAASLLVLAIATGCLVYLCLPKVPVELKLSRYGWSQSRLTQLAYWFADLAEGATLAKAREEMLKFLRDPRNAGQWENPVAGGVIHEEDSPGNYTLRETDGALEFIGYDAAGAPHVLQRLSGQPKKP